MMGFKDRIREGMTVRSADGHKLGKVALLTEGDFVIEKGLFFPKDYTCSYSFVRDIENDEVILSHYGKDLKEGYATGTTAGATTGGLGAGAMSREETRIPLAEEELTAEKYAKSAGEVRVKKDVVTERKDISVPVTREEVHVETVPASGRDLRPGEASFKESTTTIPITEEEVEIKKRPVVREELRVSKERHTEERRASENLRKEKADVDEKGDISRSKYDDPNWKDPNWNK